MFPMLASDKVWRNVSQEKRTRHESYFTKSLKGSRRPESAAASEMVVLSPPGIIKASHRDSCCFVRTSVKSNKVVVFLFRNFAMKSAAFLSSQMLEESTLQRKDAHHSFH